MTDEIEIRRIGAEEWRELRAVRLRALADAPHAFATTHAEAATGADDEWRRFGARVASGSTNAAFVAVADGRFVGLVGGYVPDNDPGCVHLVQMWTAPEARRGGVGRRLVEAVLTFAGERSVRLAVIRGNDDPRLLYETMGFLADERPPLAGDPCLDELHYVRRPSPG